MSHRHDDPRYPVQKTDEEWRAALSPTEYQIARHAATERAFTGRFWDHWQNGVYQCVGCGETLFESGTKFDAGCGWPSYWQAVDEGRIERVVDESHGMTRVEVRCAQCGSHLGHVFDDEGYGTPTDQRYCINSISLRLTPQQ